MNARTIATTAAAVVLAAGLAAGATHQLLGQRVEELESKHEAKLEQVEEAHAVALEELETEHADQLEASSLLLESTRATVGLRTEERNACRYLADLAVSWGSAAADGHASEANATLSGIIAYRDCPGLSYERD